MVDARDKRRKIWESGENYNAVMEESVPPEFRGMAVLFDDSLLESWYKKVPEHRYVVLEMSKVHSLTQLPD